MIKKDLEKLDQLTELAHGIDYGISKGKIDNTKLETAQKKLNKTASYFNEKGENELPQAYIIYELQALISWCNGSEDEALNFIRSARIVKGDGKLFTINGRALLASREFPLEFQYLIKNQRSNAFIMAILAALTIWGLPWTFFYIYFGTQLNPKELPNKALVKLAAVLTLPLCLGVIPIIIDAGFWNLNRKIDLYEEHGAEVFKEDGEWISVLTQQKKRNVVILSIIGAIFICLVGIVAYAAMPHS